MWSSKVTTLSALVTRSSIPVRFFFDIVRNWVRTHNAPLTEKIAPSTPKLSADEAVKIAEKTLGGQKNDIEPALQFLARPDGSVSLVHAVQVQNEDDESFVEAYVDAHSGKVISMNDFVADASVSLLFVR